MPWPSKHHINNVVTSLFDEIEGEVNYRNASARAAVEEIVDKILAQWAEEYPIDAPYWYTPEDEIPYVLRRRDEIVDKILCHKGEVTMPRMNSPKVSIFEGIDFAALEAEQEKAYADGKLLEKRWKALFNEIRWTDANKVITILWRDFEKDEREALLSSMKRIVDEIHKEKFR